MAANEIHVDDVGTVFEVTLKQDLSTVLPLDTATTIQAWLRDPDLVTTVKDVTLVTDGSDGLVRYTSAAGDLHTAGIWSLQFYVVFPSGTWHSDIWKFNVHGNLSE